MVNLRHSRIIKLINLHFLPRFASATCGIVFILYTIFSNNKNLLFVVENFLRELIGYVQLLDNLGLKLRERFSNFILVLILYASV